MSQLQIRLEPENMHAKGTAANRRLNVTAMTLDEQLAAARDNVIAVQRQCITRLSSLMHLPIRQETGERIQLSLDQLESRLQQSFQRRAQANRS
jgi:hypothetical protein